MTNFLKRIAPYLNAGIVVLALVSGIYSETTHMRSPEPARPRATSSTLRG